MRAADCSFATEGSRQYAALQPPVAKDAERSATVRSVGTKPSAYWRQLCAPILKRRKDVLGRKVPEREIAAYVEAESGKDTSRGAVNLFLLGEREPYISQFIALCTKLELSPLDVLAGRLVINQVGEETHQQERKIFNQRNNLNVPLREPTTKKRGKLASRK